MPNLDSLLDPDRWSDQPPNQDQLSQLPPKVSRYIQTHPSYAEGQRPGGTSQMDWPYSYRGEDKEPRSAPPPNIPQNRYKQDISLKSFKKGGKVKKTAVYKLHKGEKVLSAKQARDQEARDKALLQKTRYRRQG